MFFFQLSKRYESAFYLLLTSLIHYSTATFSTGISIENTFNRNSILILERPYESQVFLKVQEGDIPAVAGLLEAGNASIYDVDPYGLGLLYVGIPICYQTIWTLD